MKYLDGGLIILTNDFNGGLVKYIKDFDFKNPKIIVEGKEPTNLVQSVNPFLQLNENRILFNIGFHDTIYVIDMKQRNILDQFIIGNNETYLRSKETTKLVSDIMARNSKKYEDIYLSSGFPMRMNDFFIIPMMSSTTNVMFS